MGVNAKTTTYYSLWVLNLFLKTGSYMVERCKSGLESEIGVLISKYTLILKKERGRKEKTKLFWYYRLGKIYLKRYLTDLKLKSKEDFCRL